MANPKIRSASLFISGLKAAMVEGIKYSYATGDEPQFGDPGYIGHSDGAGTTNLSATAIIPVAGMGHKLFQAMKNRTDFDISLALIDGAIHQITMRLVKGDVTGSQKNGTLMGDFEWQGGEPKISG